MKILKVILLLTVTLLFMSAPQSVEAAKDCSHAKKLHEKLLCKMNKDDGSSVEKSTTKSKGEKKSILQRIKEMGGKNLGEEG